MWNSCNPSIWKGTALPSCCTGYNRGTVLSRLYILSSIWAFNFPSMYLLTGLSKSAPIGFTIKPSLAGCKMYISYHCTLPLKEREQETREKSKQEVYPVIDMKTLSTQQ